MSRNIDTTIARARTLLVAIHEALICNPDPARIAELLTDAAARIAELEAQLAALAAAQKGSE